MTEEETVTEQHPPLVPPIKAAKPGPQEPQDPERVPEPPPEDQVLNEEETEGDYGTD